MAKKETKKPEKVKEKKGKDKKAAKDKPAAAAVPPAASTPAGVAGMGAATGTPSIPLANMSPDQMNAAQLEQAIKDSSDPSARLKKLRSPLNVRSCLLNILILIVLTLGIVILWCWLALDKFDFGNVMGDMMDKFGITEFFTNLGKTISGWFS